MANLNTYLRKDGRWEVRIYSTDINGRRRYKSVYGQTEEEAERKAMYLYNSTFNHCLLTKMTVKDLIVEYIQRKQPLLKESTVANYRMKAEKHIIPALRKISCTELSAHDIYSFMDERRRERLSERYIYDFIVLLKSVFRYANNTYNIRNTMSGIVMPKRSKPDVTVLTVDQQNILKRFLARNNNLTALVIFLSLYTGIRIGELCTLRWQDIDLEKRILTINKTIQGFGILRRLSLTADMYADGLFRPLFIYPSQSSASVEISHFKLIRDNLSCHIREMNNDDIGRSAPWFSYCSFPNLSICTLMSYLCNLLFLIIISIYLFQICD